MTSALPNVTKQLSNLCENTLEQLDDLENQRNPDNAELERTSSVSTFTRHTNKIHALIKEVIMGLILIVLIVEGVGSFKK